MNKSSYLDRSGMFEITKENYYIYSLFEDLYNSIKNSEIFEIDDSQFLSCKTIVDKNKEFNERCKKFNNWNKLFCDGIITWKCDDYSFEEANNLVSIEKEEDKFIIDFMLNDCMNYSHCIRFRNSGSCYEPYNSLFLKMFLKFQGYDLEDRQIHFEEYLYEKRKVLKKL